jgi:hypothetical protein
MSNLVEVRPLKVKKWHGKEGKESFTQAKVIRAYVNPQTNRYETGMTEEDKEKVVKLGFSGDLTDLYTGNPHPTWDEKEFKISLPNRTFFLNKNIPRDYVKICILKGSKFVADSLTDYENDKFPYATHYIHDEDSQVEVKASKIAVRNEAIIKASKLSKDKKLAIVIALGGRNLKNNSDDFVNTELDNLIMKDPEAFLRVMQRDPKLVSSIALVYTCIDKGILRKDAHKIMYLDDVIGYDVDEAAAYLEEPVNQSFKILIKEKLYKL